jgi:hypothetical protein
MTIDERRAIPGVAVELNGIVYRSITEAMWRIVGDTLGWELEPEPTSGKNRIPGLYYIPDFFSFTLDVFVEVKGSLPDDYAKQIVLAGATGKQVLVLAGRPGMYAHRLVEPDGRIGEIISTERPHNHPRWDEAIKRVREAFPQWNAPTPSIVVGQKLFDCRVDEEMDGFFHPTFGAGIIHGETKDKYGNTLLLVSFVGKGGIGGTNPVPIRTNRIKYTRRGKGWTVGSTRSIDPSQELWTTKSFYHHRGEHPLFFCRECECILEAYEYSSYGEDITIYDYVKIGEDETIFGRINVYDRYTIKTSLYCISCASQYDLETKGGDIDYERNYTGYR